jgi:hypothetical protein
MFPNAKVSQFPRVTKGTWDWNDATQKPRIEPEVRRHPNLSAKLRCQPKLLNCKSECQVAHPSWVVSWTPDYPQCRDIAGCSERTTVYPCLKQARTDKPQYTQKVWTSNTNTTSCKNSSNRQDIRPQYTQIQGNSEKTPPNPKVPKSRCAVWWKFQNESEQPGAGEDAGQTSAPS